MSEITINKTGPGSPNDAPAQDDKSVDSVQPSDGTLAKASPAKIDQKSSFSLLAWIRASRPTYFVATLVPLFLGFFAAARYESVYKPWFFILILVACFLVHLATNLANDLFESSSGIDTKDTIGGTKVIQEGKISPRQIKLALFLSYAAALVLAYFIVKDNKILWAMVIFAFLSSLFYVCPPIKYGHRGLGEVFVFINMGLIMTVGTYMALTDHFNPRVIALSLPVAVMVAGILYFQSLPEIETDKKAGKKTLAVILGPHRATFFQFIIWPIAWFLMINLWLTGLTTIWVLLGLITFPIHWLVMHRIRK
ncbi:MAG: 1,4-dihydroxy-2-naphthoate octaprenyltransferase, partial [Deltaproteobacteria bacterium]|nr:1,4-dihydroxy-2-naphthoate octaprenyltransferase [Deltaproteobacteria bacterium]